MFQITYVVCAIQPYIIHRNVPHASCGPSSRSKSTDYEFCLLVRQYSSTPYYWSTPVPGTVAYGDGNEIHICIQRNERYEKKTVQAIAISGLANE